MEKPDNTYLLSQLLASAAVTDYRNASAIDTPATTLQEAIERFLESTRTTDADLQLPPDWRDYV